MADTRKEKIKRLEKSIKKRQKRLDDDKWSRGDIDITPKRKPRNKASELDKTKIRKPVLKNRPDGTLGGTVVRPTFDTTKQLREKRNKRTVI